MVVVVNVVFDASLQFVDVAKPVQVDKFRLERSEEAFHRGVIEAISFTRHALSDSLLF